MAAIGALDKMTGSATGITDAVAPDRLNRSPVPGTDFKDALARAAQGGLEPQSPAAVGGRPGGEIALKFSAHAVDRMKSRGISFPPELMKGIESAVGRAAQKGSRDTLVLAGDNALIVSVKNNTVVTVMDRQAIRENVFTNIDSTVVV